MLGIGLITPSAQALEVEAASIEGAFLQNYRYTAAPAYTVLGGASPAKEHWTHQIAINLDITLVQTPLYKVYWHNQVEGQATTKRFRRVHYDFEWGYQHQDYLQVFWAHRSEHLLDTFLGEYPLKDAFGVRLIIKQ
jgi:hypothetical protein